MLLPLASRLPRPLAYGLAMAVALVDLPTALGAHHRRELGATHRPTGMDAGGSAGAAARCRRRGGYPNSIGPPGSITDPSVPITLGRSLQ